MNLKKLKDIVETLKAEKGVDRVLAINHVSSNCTEAVCVKGGDTITYRIYNNGMITEK